MKIVMDKDGNVKMENGLPVYKYPDGKEAPFDAKATVDTYEEKVTNLTEEKDRHFNTAEKAKKDLLVFKGVDPKKAKEHAEIVKSLSDKEILDANGVKALHAEYKESTDAVLKAQAEEHAKVVEERDGKITIRDKAIYNLAVLSEFATSPWFSGTPENPPKTYWKAKDAAVLLKNNFKVDLDEDGEATLKAVDNKGNPILSRTEHGAPAPFNEAVEIILDKREDKNDIMRDANAAQHGPGSQGNLAGNQDGDKKDSLSKISSGLKKQYGNVLPSSS